MPFLLRKDSSIFVQSRTASGRYISGHISSISECSRRFTSEQRTVLSQSMSCNHFWWGNSTPWWLCLFCSGFFGVVLKFIEWLLQPWTRAIRWSFTISVIGKRLENCLKNMKLYLVFSWVLFLDILLRLDYKFIQCHRIHLRAIPFSDFLRYQYPNKRKYPEKVIPLSYLLIEPLDEFFAPSAWNCEVYLVDYGWARFPFIYVRFSHPCIKMCFPYILSNLYWGMRGILWKNPYHFWDDFFSAMYLESDEHKRG